MKQKKAQKRYDHSGSTLDSFLEEEGIREETEAVATKRVLAWQLAQEMKKQKKNRLWHESFGPADRSLIGCSIRGTPRFLLRRLLVPRRCLGRESLFGLPTHDGPAAVPRDQHSA